MLRLDTSLSNIFNRCEFCYYQVKIFIYKEVSADSVDFILLSCGDSCRRYYNRLNPNTCLSPYKLIVDYRLDIKRYFLSFLTSMNVYIYICTKFFCIVILFQINSSVMLEHCLYHSSINFLKEN